MAVSWREFYSRILPDCPQCPKSIAADKAREAAIDFCTQTQAWIMRSEPSPIVAGHALYTPDTPDGVVVSAIIKGQIIKRDSNGEVIGLMELTPLNDHDLVSLGNWEMQTGEMPNKYRTFEPNRIQLIPAPSVSLNDALVLEIAVKPSHDSKLCPQFLLDSYSDAISNGAKRRLVSTPNKPWTNLSMVSFYNDEFNNQVNKVRRAQYSAHSRKGLRVRMRPF